MNANTFERGWRRVLAACCLSIPMLVACAKPNLPVSLHGVNYSGETFSYIVADPDDPKNTGGSGLIEPYAAGGTDCCYELPKKWRPGLKVSIRYTHYVGKLADKSLHDVVENQLIDVPRYADGKPGELWVLRTATGALDLVSSDFQPDHPKWPGRVKGWPVPSLAYQRERWDLYITHEKGGVKLYEKLLGQLNSAPDQEAAEAWDYSLENDRKALVGFSGPTDVKFRSQLRFEYEEGLKRSRQQLEQLTRGRP
ncbi:MAG: hypothetical protein JWQ01_3226 [Massilia sp.]|jgi:hypothetical protein|nr:hypothetical protein [Massilia sp.]